MGEHYRIAVFSSNALFPDHLSLRQFITPSLRDRNLWPGSTQRALSPILKDCRVDMTDPSDPT